MDLVQEKDCSLCVCVHVHAVVSFLISSQDDSTDVDVFGFENLGVVIMTSDEEHIKIKSRKRANDEANEAKPFSLQEMKHSGCQHICVIN